MSAAARDASRQNSPSTSARRERAPTITIDTSAVNTLESGHAESHQMQSLSPQTAPEEADGHQHPESYSPPYSGDEPSGELRVATSFDGRESRPSTSAHNVSTSISKGSNSFLSVPTARSRGNSVDSEDDVRSPISYGGDTVIPSSGSSQNSDSRHAATVHSGDHLLSTMDALKPDPGHEADFEVPNNPFAFSPGQLNKLLNPKNLSAFRALGGLSGLEKGLRTDRSAGLSMDEHHLEGEVSFSQATSIVMSVDGASSPHQTQAPSNSRNEDDGSFTDRKRIFSDNTLPERKSKSFFELAWLAYNDKVLILLTVAAVVSLSLGIYESVRPRDPEPAGWVEGVAIIVAIVIVVFVGAANDYGKERQFVKLNRKKDDRVIKVMRSGRWQELSVRDVLVGDVVHIEPGDVTPVDGIFISGHDVQCDESSATGESDVLRKTPGEAAYKAIEQGDFSSHKLDPFIISGAKVTEGVGTFLVTATGIHSTYGKTLMSLQEDPQTTPLQSKLNKLAEYIAKLGLSAGLVLFVVTFIQFIVRFARGQLSNMDPQHVAQDFLQLFITAVTIIVVAVPEGLPLAVTLALAFATRRMLRENNLVRQLRACETMGNATTICSDKTGTLTQNKMSVVAGTFGTMAMVDGKQSTAKTESSPNDKPSKPAGIAQRAPVGSVVGAVQTLAENVKERLKTAIAINSTAFEGVMDGENTFIGSKTETAMLTFARDHLGMQSVSHERENVEIVQFLPFDSKRKFMATTIAVPGKGYRMFVTGASEIVLARCRSALADPMRGLTEAKISEQDLAFLNKAITDYATHSLRTIAVAYQDFEYWPPAGSTKDKDDPTMADMQEVFQNMTFLAVVGIKDPLRDGVVDAVRACQHAGVFVRMVTGDNIMTAKAIAEDCGIFTAGGVIMEGPQFRKMNRVQMNQVIPRLQVLARSSPEDKRILVKRLRDLGETVAVTGDGTNDAPALKTADVGFSMGISGTEVAKEASAIILMDDNFESIVKAMMWGRAVNDSVKKFLQFQLTVNITAVLLAFISAVSSPDQQSVISAVQLLWVNLIMDTFAALALATDPPTPSILDRDPQPKSASLITTTMWKMIIGQSIYQLVVTLVLYYAGPTIFHIEYNTNATLVFNAFVWMQIFNQYNSRRLDNKFNILEGVHHNYFFIGIQFIICGAQVLIIFVGGNAFKVTPIDGRLWATSVVIGLISVVIGVIVRLIPDEWVRKLIPTFFKRRKSAPDVLVSDEEQPSFQWNPALEEIKEELAFLKMIHGGRLRRLRHKLEHPRDFLPRSRSASRSRTDSVPHTPVTGARNSSNTHLAPPSTPGGAGNEHGLETSLNSTTLAPPTPDSARRSPHMRKRGRSHSSSTTFAPAAAMAGIVAGSIGGGFSPLGSGGGVARRNSALAAADAFATGPLRGREDLLGHPGVQIHPDTLPDDPILADAVHDFRKGPPSQIPHMRPAFAGKLDHFSA